MNQSEIDDLVLKAERFDLALSVANDGIYDWDVQKGTIFFDQRYYTMAGYTPYEFPGTFEEWQKRVHPDDLKHLSPIVEAYLAGKISTYDQEFRFRCKDNTWMWIRARVKVIERDEQGNPLRVVGTHSDITDRKTAEFELDTYRKYLESMVDERTTDLIVARDQAEKANNSKLSFCLG